MSICHYSFVSLRCGVPVSMHYRLCLVTVGMKAMQNLKLVGYSKTKDCRCAFSCSICDKKDHFTRSSQSSICQGYDGIQRSWEDIMS
jgi:hypothetical protein